MEQARRLIAEERERKTGFLDLGNLGLTAVPDELFELTHLEGLNLGFSYVDREGKHRDTAGRSKVNFLADLPDEFRRLTGLSFLSLRLTGIASLEPLQTLRSLRSLDCQFTQVTTLEPLRSLVSLKLLDCSYCQVTSLEPLRGLASLQLLVCVGTQILSLEPLRTLRSLQSLMCSFTQVASLEPLRALSALQSLDCTATLVTSLEPLRTLPALQSLACMGTGVTSLEPLRALPALRSLSCAGTQVPSLEPLCRLSSLQSLDCSGVAVTSLEPLRALPALQSLDCSGTGVASVGPLRAVSTLQALNCGRTRVSSLEPLRALRALQSLNCSSTRVTSLEPLRALPGLQLLDCSDTSVTSLEPLQSLPALQSLACSSTSVTTLESLCVLPLLQSLDCSYTQVASLEPLRALPLLQSLNCSYTQVANLEPLRALTRLQSLDCSGTQVTHADPLVTLPNVSRLKFNQCRLSNLPVQLVFKASLVHLFLQEAVVAGIPREVLSRSRQDDCLNRIRAHVRDLDAGAEEVRETKIIALGNGRVGKTQICRRLRGMLFDPSIPSTHGISVTTVPWNASSNGERLNLWDFGGQDIYHGAHSLFLRTQAVFLVVWHPDFERRQEEEHEGLVFRNYPLAYWLEYVRTLGLPGSPIIVVQSQCDRPENEVKRPPVDDRFLDDPALKLCWYSAAKDRGRAALDEALQQAMEAIRERDGVATIGAGRARVVRQLEEWRDADQGLVRSTRQHRTLSLGEFGALCERVGGVSSPESLLDYLHNLGVVFHQPGLFHDRIILDQSWALDAVYAVFERQSAYRQLVGSRGRFTRALLELLVWKEYSEDEQRLFLSLMESAGICFKCRDADRTLGLDVEYIAPDLLPDKAALAAELAGRWDETAPSRRLEYRYDFLHSGLMRSLTCDAGARAGEAGVYWKYGFWVYDKQSGARALVEEERTSGRGGRIVVQVQGGREAELGAWLRKRITERNRLFGYSRLEPEVDDFPEERVDLIAHFDFELVASPRTAPARTHLAAGAAADDPTRGPVFERLPPSAFPRTSPQIFVSYAWGDATPEGKRREQIVDDLCRSLAGQSVEVLRDRQQMAPGARISEFMDRLAAGDFIIVVVSDKYLRSAYCMYELFRIYRNCGSNPDRFLKRVVPLILPDARLGEVSERLSYARHWKDEKGKLEPLIKDDPSIVGGEAFAKYRMIQEFSHNVSDVLEYLVDKLVPRDLERMAKDEFRDVLAMVRSG